MEKKEAMEILRKHYSNAPFSERTALETFIPELAESEDEKIRKKLIKLFTANNVEDYGGVTNKQIVAWLEKKGEQKPDDNVESTTQSYITPNQEFFQWVYDRLIYVHNENPNVDYMLSLKERIKDMQKLSWSEEDEIGFGDALLAIEQARTIAKDENDMGNLWYAEKWLKSLKDRVHPNEAMQKLGING